MQKGETPLHHAAMRGNVEVVNALLKAGSRVDEKDEVSMFCTFNMYSMHAWIPCLGLQYKCNLRHDKDFLKCQSSGCGLIFGTCSIQCI